ncbi:hypothetical protein AB0K18_05665 [Nonomuraea sp. NPDC049421]|uniref:hypothetical protein n=1 Tax=Nonomuraea sp. NPDC049421 TaxID=3155275 RepID=UPI0034271985
MSQVTSGDSPFREAIWPHPVLHAQLGRSARLWIAAPIVGRITGKEIDRERLNGSHPRMSIPLKK